MFTGIRGHPLYSRQISTHELQPRQNGQVASNSDWDTLSVASSIVTKRENGKPPRRGSVSSNWSMSESSSAASTHNGQIGATNLSKLT